MRATAASDVPVPVAVTVTAKEFSLTGMPASLKGGLTRITYVNAGKLPHTLQLAWIDGFHSNAEIAKVISGQGGPIPSWIHGAGGVGEVAPGASASVTLNLRKGTYRFWSDESDDQKGTSDFKSGMTGKMTVTSDNAAAEPTAKAKIVAKEYGFEVSGLKAGKNTVAFSNAGKQLHHVIMMPINAGKTIADVTKALMSDPNAKNAPPPPVDFTKGQGTEVIDPGVTEVVELTLPAGRWVFLCFMNDRAGGAPHFTKGMIKEVVIK